MTTNCIAVAVLSRSPELGQIGFVLVLAGWLLLQRLSCVQTDDLEKIVADAVTDAMHAARITTKEMADRMRIDESQLRKQLRAEPHQHLSLARLVRVWEIWIFLGPALLAIVARRRWAEVLSDLRVRKSA